MDTETNSVKKRMKHFLSYIGISEGSFESMCGLGNGWVSNIGDSIRTSTQNKILNIYPELNIVWLLTGEGSMLKSENIKKEEVREIDPEYIEVELISKYAYAGYLTGYGDMEYLEMLPKVKVIVDRMVRGNYKCFEVKGDSMVDGSFESWLDGDIVLGREVKRDLWLPKLHINKCDFIIVHKDGILLKRIIYQDNNNGTITIHSLNPDKSTYPDEEIYLDDVMQIFSTVQLVKRETRR